MGLSRGCRVIVVLLLTMMTLNYVFAILRTTVTNDELVHIPAGYFYWNGHHFELNSEHPPLVKLWAALPVLLMVSAKTPDLPADSSEAAVNQRFDFFHAFWLDHADRFALLSMAPRLMMIPLALLLGVLIFHCAHRLFGAPAGLFALALYCLEPTVLAHGRVVHTDLPAALTYLLFFYALYRYVLDSNLRSGLFLGLATGLALVTKFSMIVVLPVLAGVITIQSVRDRRIHVREVFVVASIALLLVNAAYFFAHPRMQPVDIRILSILSAEPSIESRIIDGLSYVLPTYFIYGLAEFLHHSVTGHPASIWNLHAVQGWWFYFLVAFVIKATIPFIILSTAALVWCAFHRFRSRSAVHLMTTVPIVVYTIVAMASHVNIGIRHFLPVYPFLFILAGCFLQRVSRRRNVWSVGIPSVLLCWCALEAIRPFPHYTSYTNQFARGPNWAYLSDSNVEWGDDIPYLVNYLEKQGVHEIKGALLGGSLTTRLLGLQYVDVMTTPPAEQEYVAIGASFLNGSTVPYSPNETESGRINHFDQFRSRKPEAVFGNSIYLYRMGADSQ